MTPVGLEIRYQEVKVNDAVGLEVMLSGSESIAISNVVCMLRSELEIGIETTCIRK